MQVTKEQAKEFGKVWTHKGVAIFMDDTHYQFASDFANIAIKSFINQAQAAQREAAKKQQIEIVRD